MGCHDMIDRGRRQCCDNIARPDTGGDQRRRHLPGAGAQPAEGDPVPVAIEVNGLRHLLGALVE